MAVSRREFLKASVATSVAAGSLSWFGASEVFGADTVVIPSASHWGPFKAVVKKGVLVGVLIGGPLLASSFSDELAARGLSRDELGEDEA